MGMAQVARISSSSPFDDNHRRAVLTDEIDMMTSSATEYAATQHRAHLALILLH